LYADDMIALAEEGHKIQDFLRTIEKWCRDWWMALGIQKCGVMLWSIDEHRKTQHANTRYRITEGEIPKVDEYKYLGIVADDTLPFSRTPVQGRRVNEETYVNFLVKKGLATLHHIRPSLINHNCPIPIKVMLIRTFLIP
ncbi:hypothetical protein BDN71DRAFT_1342635, partial [Pleurotus eryngii]